MPINFTDRSEMVLSVLTVLIVRSSLIADIHQLLREAPCHFGSLGHIGLSGKGIC